MKKLSELLRETRLEQNYTLEQIAKDLKIKREFLQAIEDGRYKDLPSDAYAAGFVKNYGTYLGLSENKTMALFRRDYKTQKLDYVPSYRKKKYVQPKNFLLTRKGGLLTLALAGILIYLGFQLSSIFIGPELTVETPSSGEKVEQNIVEVKGETDPYATLEVNGEASRVNLDGSFSKSLYVFSGNQIIKVVAKNRFGKETVEEIKISVE